MFALIAICTPRTFKHLRNFSLAFCLLPSPSPTYRLETEGPHPVPRMQKRELAVV